MVSRRRILSRSIDDLDLDSSYVIQEDEEDVWYQKEKLYKDHIQEVLDKWTHIDDEIWAKVIIFEKNRRIAKAYARAPVLTVNGSDDGFDGFRIGLCGFDNPMRDPKTEEAKRHIRQGVKVKMDDQGNILVKRVSRCNVFVKVISSPGDDTSIGNDVLQLPNCALELDKPVKMFDMKKFQQNLNKEFRRAYPDRKRLEQQCLSAVAFVKNEPTLLSCPIWVLIINIVAIDMLKSKLSPVNFRIPDIKNRPGIPVPEEDPYSAPEFCKSYCSSRVSTTGPMPSMVVAAQKQVSQQHTQRRSEKPPKLPPRHVMYPHETPEPDYDDIDEEKRPKGPSAASRSKEKPKNGKIYDDLYYCGLQARLPDFVKHKIKKPEPKPIRYAGPISHYYMGTSALHYPHTVMRHATSFDSEMDLYSSLNTTLTPYMSK